MFVMDFVSSPNTASVPVIRVTKHLKSLVDENIVHEKISHSIGKNTQSYGETSPKVVLIPADEAQYTDNGIKNEKGIITLPPTAVVFVMMVLMQDP